MQTDVIGMNKTDSHCKSMFRHETSELKKSFTQIWIQYINAKENSVVQVNTADL